MDIQFFEIQFHEIQFFEIQFHEKTLKKQWKTMKNHEKQWKAMQNAGIPVLSFQLFVVFVLQKACISFLKKRIDLL